MYLRLCAVRHLGNDGEEEIIRSHWKLLEPRYNIILQLIPNNVHRNKMTHENNPWFTYQAITKYTVFYFNINVCVYDKNIFLFHLSTLFYIQIHKKFYKL